MRPMRPMMPDWNEPAKIAREFCKTQSTVISRVARADAEPRHTQADFAPREPQSAAITLTAALCFRRAQE
jgi:hypothetical protein